MKSVKDLSYSNLMNNIERENEEISKKKDYSKIEKVLAEKYLNNDKKKNSKSYIRQGISVKEDEIKILKDIYLKLLSSGEVVNKSQIYRVGLHILKDLSVEKIVTLLRKI